MLTRAEAWQLLCDWTPSEKLRTHARAVELVLRDLAAGQGQEPASSPAMKGRPSRGSISLTLRK